MNPNLKAWARQTFISRLGRIGGMDFQNLFVDIMQASDPDFRPVKPHGNQGDWKNDGFIPGKGVYFQVYSPEVFDEALAVRKLVDDFEGLWLKWADLFPSGVSKFFFVLNDRYRVTPGGYPDTYAALEFLKAQHKLAECGLLIAKDLENILLELPDDIVIGLLGYPPNPAMLAELPFTTVNEILLHLATIMGPVVRAQSLRAPDFNLKISFNKLGLLPGLHLHTGDLHVGELEEFFAANSDFCRQDTRNRLNSLYDMSKKDINCPTEDDQFWFILDRLTPYSSFQDRRNQKDLQDAALVIMAFFFASCDIFEEPPQ